MKKFLKIFGFCMLGLLGLVVLALGVAWITGAFSTEKINITALTISQENVVCDNAPVLALNDNSMEVVVVGDTTITSTITHEPENATEKALTVRYIHGKDLLEETPDTIASGQPFTLKFKKDANGLPIGGEVEIKLVNSTRLVDYTIKVLVDRPLLSDDIKYTTTDFVDVTSGTNIGKIVTASNPNAVKTLTLNTLNANAIAPKKGAVVFTNSEILEYKNKKMLYVITGDTKKFEKVEDGDTNSNVETTFNVNGTVDFKYSFRALGASQNVGIKSYVHKTFAMQKDFVEDWLYAVINGNLENYPIADLNVFINKYYAYIAYGENEEFMNSNTIVDEETGIRTLLDTGDMLARLNKVMDAIFATAEQGIIISDVEIANIACKDLITYKVFDEKTYNVETIGDSDTNYDYLGVVLNSSTQTDIDNRLLKDSIGNLVVAPYIKYEISGDAKVPDEHSLWQYETIDNGGEIMEGAPIIESGPKVTGLDGNEYLKYVKIDDTWYQFNEDYVTIKKTMLDDGKATWSIHTLQPTNDADTNTLHVVYSIEAINSEGDASFKYAQSKLKIEYSSPTNFNWNNFTDNKVLLHNDTSISTDKIMQADAYQINTITLHKNQVISENALNELQYKHVRFYMLAESNVFEYNTIKYEIFDMAGRDTVKLATMSGTNTYFSIEDQNTFYDLGENPTLTAKNVTMLDPEDIASSVKIIACILQTDVNGEFITHTIESETLRKVVANTQVKEFTVEYFAQNLYVYYLEEIDETAWLLTSSTEGPLNVNSGDVNVKLAISALPLFANEVEGGEDLDGVCDSMLNFTALRNYFDLYNGTISFSLDYGQGTYRPSDGTPASEFVQINNSDIDYVEHYITVAINFNVLEDYPIYNNGTDNTDDDIELATTDNPIQLDFIVYLTPRDNSSIYTTIPYYNLENTAIARINIVRAVDENEGETGGEEGGTDTGEQGGSETPDDNVE